MNKVFIVSIIFFVLLAETVVMALTITPLGSGRYLLNFSDGRTAIAYNISYDRRNDLLTMNLNVTDGKGARIKDMVEMREYAQNAVGRANHMDETVIKIN